MHEQQTQPTAQPANAYETCEQCAAPVESAQRYCVNCGTRRRHVDDPAARFMSAATKPAPVRAARRASAGAAGAARARPALASERGSRARARDRADPPPGSSRRR